MKLYTRKTIHAVSIGALLALGPFVFWRIFLQQLPVTGIGEATLTTRFDERDSDADQMSNSGERTQLRELLPYPVTDLFLDGNREVFHMYEKGTGRAFSVYPATLKVEPLSEERLEGFHSTVWSPNGREVISLFTENDQSEYRYFDYDSKQVATLPQTTQLVAFSPDGQSIVTVRKLHETAQLWLSRPDGSDEWLLMATRADIQNIWWPQADKIALQTRRPSGLDDLVSVDMNALLKVLLEKKDNLDVRWSRNGISALVSFVDTEGALTLSLLHTESEELRELGIQTKASKCAWHRQGRSLTCGVKSATSSRDSVVSLNADSTGHTVRYEAPEDVYIGLLNPISLPRDNGVAFINLFDERPYIITW